MTAFDTATAPGVRPDGANPKRSWSRHRLLLGLLVGVPCSVVAVYLAARGLDGHRLWQALASADPVRLALAVVAIGAIYALQSARWRWIARGAGSLSWRAYLQMVLGSVAVNNVVPGRPGELLRSVWLARTLRISQGRSFATVAVDRSSDVLVLVAALIATYMFIPHHGWLRHIVLAAAVAGLLVLIGLGATRFWASRRSAQTGARPRSSWLGAQASALTHGMASVVNRRDLPVAYGLTLLAWSTWCFAAWLVASSIGLHLSLLEVVFATAVINLGASLPSSPGFIGTFQWLSVAALGLFGVARADAFAFSILMHAVWYVPTTIAGGLIALRTGVAWRVPRPSPVDEIDVTGALPDPVP